MRTLYGQYFYLIKPQRWLTSLLAITLSACTIIAPPSTPHQTSWDNRKAQLERIQQWHLNGKIAIQTAHDSGSATIDWQENNGHYNVALYGPLGAGAIKLTGNPSAVTLTMPDGKKLTAASAEQLLAKSWGFNLPVSYLRYWIRGLPVPGLNATTSFDEYHRIATLTQQNWQVQILNYTRAGRAELPSRLSISSPLLRGKLVIHEWEVK